MLKMCLRSIPSSGISHKSFVGELFFRCRRRCDFSYYTAGRSMGWSSLCGHNGARGGGRRLGPVVDMVVLLGRRWARLRRRGRRGEEVVDEEATIGIVLVDGGVSAGGGCREDSNSQAEDQQAKGEELHIVFLVVFSKRTDKRGWPDWVAGSPFIWSGRPVRATELSPPPGRKPYWSWTRCVIYVSVWTVIAAGNKLITTAISINAPPPATEIVWGVGFYSAL